MPVGQLPSSGEHSSALKQRASASENHSFAAQGFIDEHMSELLKSKVQVDAPQSALVRQRSPHRVSEHACVGVVQLSVQELQSLRTQP